MTTFLFISAGAAEPESFKEGWPHLFQNKGNQVVVYQPQLTEWQDHKILRAQAAVAVTLKGQKTEYFGARAGHRSRGGKTIAGLETSEGGKVLGGYNKWTDQGAVVGKDKHGDVYVGRDGNVYRREGDNWQKNSGSGWTNVDTSQARADAQAHVNQRQSQSQARANQRQFQSPSDGTDTNRSAMNRMRQSRPGVQTDLNHHYQSRQRSNRIRQGLMNRWTMNRSLPSRGRAGRSRRR